MREFRRKRVRLGLEGRVRVRVRVEDRQTRPKASLETSKEFARLKAC